MRVVVGSDEDGGIVGEGEAIDLRGADCSTEAVRTAIRSDHRSVAVDCPSPSRHWSRLVCPTDDTAPLDRLVAAARSRGHHPPVERALAATERELRELTVEEVNTAPARRRLAEAGTEVERLREAVATARGRLQSRREMDADTAEAESALADATRELSAAETERVAAEQAHDAAQRRVREAREARDRRLQLQDRLANRRRDTRRALANAVAEAFAAAVDAVPGEATLSIEPLELRGDEVTAALAAARIADLRAPVVDTTGRFDSATAAVEAFDAPVVRL
jgi:chromosome segregation ATPase